MKSAMDTRNFDKFDEEEPWFFDQKEAKNVKSDLNFVGYTYKRDSENERSEVVNALENLERNRNLLVRPKSKENPENFLINPEKTLTHNILKGISNSKSPMMRNNNINNGNNNAGGNLGKALSNFQNNGGPLKEKALLINLYNNNHNFVMKEKIILGNYNNNNNNNNNNTPLNNLKITGNVKPNHLIGLKNTYSSNNNMKLAQDSIKAMGSKLNDNNSTNVKNKKGFI